MRRTFALVAGIVLAGGVGLLWHATYAAPGDGAPPSPRRPVAVAVIDDGKRLLVANRRGTVSVVDVGKQQVVAELDAGRKLSDLVALPDGRALATDEDAHQLIVLTRRDDAWEVGQRLDVAASPVCVRASGNLAFVAGLWSHQVSVVDVAEKRPLKVLKTIDLSFAPRLLLPDSSKLIAADAFAGRIAVIDPANGVVESVRDLPGHNVRGLALTPDGKELLVAHQYLSEKAQTSAPDIHWGNLLANHLRTLRLSAVLDPKADLLDGSHRVELGTPGRGAADPSGLAVTANGKVIVSLGGVGEVSVGKPAGDGERLSAGRRPSAVALSPDCKHAFVADTLGDAVVMIDVAAPKVVATVSLGKHADLTSAERGELLFQDGGLSLEGWMSCHSCHVDGHSNGLLADTLGDGDYGAPKRVPSLLGVKDTAPYAWNGSVESLGQQIRKSIASTMRGTKPTDEQVRDLTAYLESLSPSRPLERDAEAVARGHKVFEKQSCSACHAPPAFTSPRTFDVGLRDEYERKLFNPPSLRGVGHGGPFFHDGRAASLEDVLAKQRHQLKGDLNEEERRDLLRYLKSL